MGSRGDCFDNAVAEELFATLKKELIHGRTWPSKAELRTPLSRRPGTSLAASRLAATNKITFTAPIPSAIGLIDS